ncbi:MAG: hypothetical protein BWY31_02972 [Lentisphaerae bacterium ADurb.Bin242]|nr:MAG: hypothetical protein BWY31_02972 [Lentisphaerae bacterium ADurb.Bin242]
MRKPFTLIELLIVISIIAILAGLLLPALNRARTTARKISCVSNMKQIGTGLQLYTDAYREFIPTYKRGWHNLILPMISNHQRVFTCPGSPAASGPPKSLFFMVTIGINACGDTTNRAFLGHDGVKYIDWKWSQIKVPSTLIYAVDSVGNDTSKYPASNVNGGYTDWMNGGSRVHFYNCAMVSGTTNHYEFANHHNSVNFLFMDMHADSMPPGKVYLMKVKDFYGDCRPLRINPVNQQYFY